LNTKQNYQPSLATAVGNTALVAGTLDFIAAYIYYLTQGGTDLSIIPLYVASALFGPGAFERRGVMIVAGVALHYVIAYVWTALFFRAYPSIQKWSSRRWLLIIIFGVSIWVVMNLVIVPLSQIGPKPIQPVNALINALILIVCIALPVVLATQKYYRQVNETGPPS